MMRLIIEYAYTRSVLVTEDNVGRLLPAADQFCVLGIVQACADFLEARLCLQNCISIWRFTDVYFCPELRCQASRFILQHFEEIGRASQEFLELTLAELCDIIERDNLNVKQEDVVFSSVVRWIAHKPHERKGYLSTVLPKIRLALMNPDYFLNVVKMNSLVKDSYADCKCIILNALRTMCNSRFKTLTSCHYYSPLSRPRLPYAILLAIGGWSGNTPTNVIESYDIQADTWVNVTQKEDNPRAYHGTVYLDGFVYCVGGYDAVEFFSEVCKFDPVTHTWHKVAPMHSRRCYVSVAVLHGCIYAMGGFDGYIRLNSAERYEPKTNQWSLIPPMHEQRSDANATTLHDKVYICGGFNGEHCLSTAEYYCPETNQWTEITPMSGRHSGLGVITYGEEVYVVGGFDGVSRLRSVEAYNPLTNTWRAMPDMIVARSNFGIEVLDDRLFVLGGFNGFTTTFYAECFDEKTNEWCSIQDMGIFRSALSCCVVPGLPNVSEYCTPRDSQKPPLSTYERELQF
ncbi:kelch-like protein 10 [Megalops cyprinoides]|uniref:kelch-like protein 10 n=1 Tax=Megalops cyprinoides TaxID=118141 RepID=UPI001865445D|nr:kelch-like protein 10 [Megalops cyprinoides]